MPDAPPGAGPAGSLWGLSARVVSCRRRTSGGRRLLILLSDLPREAVVVGVGELPAGSLVEPGFEDVEVAGGDEDGDEEGLGDAAGSGAVFGVADVQVAALQTPVDPFVVRADDFCSFWSRRW